MLYVHRLDTISWKLPRRARILAANKSSGMVVCLWITSLMYGINIHPYDTAQQITRVAYCRDKQTKIATLNLNEEICCPNR